MDPRFAASAICRIRDLPHPRFAASAICRFRDLPHPRFAASAICRFRDLPHPRFAASAICRFRDLPHPRFAAASGGALGDGDGRAEGEAVDVCSVNTCCSVRVCNASDRAGDRQDACVRAVRVLGGRQVGARRVLGAVWRVTLSRSGTPVGARATIRASGPVRARCGLLAGVCPASDAFRASGGFWRVLGAVWRVTLSRSGTPVGARATIRASGRARARYGLLAGVCPASDAVRASGGFWRVLGGLARYARDRSGTGVRVPDVSPYP